MTFSLDTPSAQTFKAEAKALRDERSRSGEPLSHSAALEEIARRHGFRDWNTARAAVPERVMVPFQVGMRVKGLYLERPFKGLVIGVQMAGDQQSFTLTVRFDDPVNVTPDFMFAALRHRVTSTVDVRGISLALRGNGKPQMQVEQE